MSFKKAEMDGEGPQLDKTALVLQTGVKGVLTFTALLPCEGCYAWGWGQDRQEAPWYIHTHTHTHVTSTTGSEWSRARCSGMVGEGTRASLGDQGRRFWHSTGVAWTLLSGGMSSFQKKLTNLNNWHKSTSLPFYQPNCVPSQSLQAWQPYEPVRLLCSEDYPARILECVAISSSRGPFWPRDRTCSSCISRRILLSLSHPGKPHQLNHVFTIIECNYKMNTVQ